MAQRIKGRRRKLLLRYALGTLIAGCVGCFAAHFVEYGVGERSGVLIKLTREGLLFKSWEGELKLTDAAGKTWKFTVPESSLARELQEKMGEVVTVHYTDRLVRQLWVGDTSNLVDGVR